MKIGTKKVLVNKSLPTPFSYTFIITLALRFIELYYYFCPNPAPPTAACAAASLAIGTLNGEQET